MGETNNRQVKTAARTFEIIDAIQTHPEPRLVDIAEAVGMTKSTAHQYLSTLVDLGYLQKSDHVYEIGLKFLDHGIYARNQYEIMHVCRPTIIELIQETQEIVWVAVEEGGMAVYVDKAKGERAIQTLAQLGTNVHLHYLASGKAILASMSDERIQEIIDQHGLPARTERSITAEDELFSEIERTRDHGYAINNGEATPGVRAVGSSITVNGQQYGAISVTGPMNRLDDATLEDDIIKPLLSATNEIELKLGYQIN